MLDGEQLERYFFHFPLYNKTKIINICYFPSNLKNGTASARLLRVDVGIIERSICNRITSYNGAVKDGMICAGTMDGGRDSCQV